VVQIVTTLAAEKFSVKKNMVGYKIASRLEAEGARPEAGETSDNPFAILDLIENR
jgi:hypothetical protein